MPTSLISPQASQEEVWVWPVCQQVWLGGTAAGRARDRENQQGSTVNLELLLTANAALPARWALRAAVCVSPVPAAARVLPGLAAGLCVASGLRDMVVPVGRPWFLGWCSAAPSPEHLPSQENAGPVVAQPATPAPDPFSGGASIPQTGRCRAPRASPDAQKCLGPPPPAFVRPPSLKGWGHQTFALSCAVLAGEELRAAAPGVRAAGLRGGDSVTAHRQTPRSLDFPQLDSWSPKVASQEGQGRCIAAYEAALGSRSKSLPVERIKTPGEEHSCHKTPRSLQQGLCLIWYVMLSE
ncbi:uncharacterized protein LOC142873425 isoform X2 [Microcebus murinus]|uniref:uncharacterized protein LOC142873425 isoform X2 n=1 Tax=Microcebus murinus TaxID=30608 RepID=UPI003F6AD26D